MAFRVQRMAEEIREEVSRIISRLKDPRIGFVTVTRVDLASDLGHVRIFVGVIGDEATRLKTVKALEHSSGFVRRELGKHLRARVTPIVHFSYDKGLDASDRVDRLLHEVKASEAEAAAARAEDGDRDDGEEQS
ncbi:MAG: 30S ribosome-binding factor RbfA [Vicinamibacteria bacterium]|nr:30S ribosome-binding factor RbfA [Vicinamibacteria bacterium]